MRHALSWTLLVLLMTAPGAAAGTRTVRGELVEMSCHERTGATGEGHAACALKCAQGGSELGILTDQGLLSVSGDMVGTSELFALLAKTVRATGDVMEKDGKFWINVRIITPVD